MTLTLSLFTLAVPTPVCNLDWITYISGISYRESLTKESAVNFTLSAPCAVREKKTDLRLLPDASPSGYQGYTFLALHGCTRASHHMYPLCLILLLNLFIVSPLFIATPLQLCGPTSLGFNRLPLIASLYSFHSMSLYNVRRGGGIVIDTISWASFNWFIRKSLELFVFFLEQNVAAICHFEKLKGSPLSRINSDRVFGRFHSLFCDVVQ